MLSPARGWGLPSVHHSRSGTRPGTNVYLKCYRWLPFLGKENFEGLTPAIKSSGPKATQVRSAHSLPVTWPHPTTREDAAEKHNPTCAWGWRAGRLWWATLKTTVIANIYWALIMCQARFSEHELLDADNTPLRWITWTPFSGSQSHGTKRESNLLKVTPGQERCWAGGWTPEPTLLTSKPYCPQFSSL